MNPDPARRWRKRQKQKTYPVLKQKQKGSCNQALCNKWREMKAEKVAGNEGRKVAGNEGGVLGACF
jgi:hypothetical protein